MPPVATACQPRAGVAPLRDLLLDCLWQAFVGPVLFWPLIQEDVAAQHIAALTLGGGGGGGGGEGGGGGGAGRAVQRGCVGPLCSLYVFERLLRAVTDQQLLTELVSALLGGSAACIRSAGAAPAGDSRPGTPERARQQQAGASEPAAAALPQRWQIAPALLVRLQYSPAAYRQALLGMLRGTDAQVAAAAVRVLAALLQSRAVSEEELELIGGWVGRGAALSRVPVRMPINGVKCWNVCCLPELAHLAIVKHLLLALRPVCAGLLPQRRRKQRQLLQALVGDGSPVNSRALLEPAAPDQPPADSCAAVCNGQRSSRRGSSAGRSSSRSSSRCGSEGGGARVRLSLSESPDGKLAVRLRSDEQQQEQQEQQEQQDDDQRQQGDQQPPPAQHPQSPQQQQAAAAALSPAQAEQWFGEVVGPLLGLLGSELLPPLSLSTVGWLLNQLLPVGKGGATLSPAQAEALAAAAARQRAALQQLLQGQWCDALAPLVAAEWGRTRQAILRVGPGSVHVAVQTWMQVGA